MQLTYAGQVFLVVVAILCVWSFILTKFWLKRLAKNRDSSKFEFAYLFVVVFSISSLFFPFTYWVSQAVYGLATKPSYDATIVSYTSEWVDTLNVGTLTGVNIKPKRSCTPLKFNSKMIRTEHWSWIIQSVQVMCL